METDYKLIQTVDPTKFNIPINNRFAKLTLSSNKKKQQKEVLQDAAILNNRQSASCNLLKVLNEIDNKVDNLVATLNPLLRSDSSSSIDQINDESMMDVLQVTDDEDNCIEQQVDLLSQKVSSMKMFEDSIIISSDEENLDIEQNDHDEEEKEEEEESVILVSDSSISQDSFQTTMGFQDTMSMAVSTSDSLLDLHLPQVEEKDQLIDAFLQDVQKAQLEQVQIIDNEVLSQQSPTISESIEKTTKAQILATADTESMTPSESNTFEPKRSMTGRTTLSMSVCESLLETYEKTHNESHVNSQHFQQNAREIAENETLLNTLQNLTEFENESINECLEKSTQPNTLSIVGETSLHEPEKIESDLAEKSLLDEEDSVIISETSKQNLTEFENDSINECLEKSTQPNTLSIVGETSHNEAEKIESDLAEKSVLDEEDSVIISETSSEEMNERTCRSSGVAVINSVENRRSSVSTEDSFDSQLQINISATINVRIHISLQSNNIEESENVARQSLPATESNDTYCSEIIELEEREKTNDEDEVLAGTLNQAKMNVPEIVLSECTTKDENIDNDEHDEHDENFMNNAEKILNELYGNTWRTPQMLKTLKKTSTGKSKKKTESLEKNEPMEDKNEIHDFSIFRKNIVKKNLDSTRFNGATDIEVFKTPVRRPARMAVLKATPIPQPDSEDFNASDDTDADETYNGSSDSDSSSSSYSGRTKGKARTSKNKENIDISNKRTSRTQRKQKSKDEIIYFDLSKEKVSIITSPCKSPPANHDEKFDEHLEDILRTCRAEEKPKMPSAVKSGSKRKLFTPNFGFEDENIEGISTTPISTLKPAKLFEDDEDSIHFHGQILPSFEVVNKPLESIKKGKPIFKITTTKTTTPKSAAKSTPKSTKKLINPLENVNSTDQKYTFLKSLEIEVSKCYCHPDALKYRENFRQTKIELVQVLYDMYNEKLFNNELNVPIKWNKKLTNTAGRCLNKRKQDIRSSVVELSEKVLTSADRLRCTLIHELCHAATWIFDGENGHGATWKNWARRANSVFPELPKIGVCHQYDIEYKYTYKCTLCNAKSHAHTKSKKVENIRCAYCHGAIEVFLNKKDKDGSTMLTPVREPKGFAKFVKESYNKYKQPDLKHGDVMKILSNEFAALKVNGGN